MAELSHDEVVEVLGRLGDVIIAEIIATGITKHELAAARERVVSDRKAHNPELSPKWSISWSDLRAAGSWARLAPGIAPSHNSIEEVPKVSFWSIPT